MTRLFAQPYNPDALGFYFESAEEFEAKVEGLTDGYGCPVEEFEIQFIDGDDAELFNACKIDQTNLELWFDTIEPLEDYEKVQLYYMLIYRSCDVDEALEKYEEVNTYEGTLLDAATDWFEDCYLHEVPKFARGYIDYEKFARDCDLGGDMCEFEYDGTTYTCTNANGL